MHDPADEPQNYKWNIFYHNPKDPRILVPKRIRVLGWNLNFAHKESYLSLVLLLAVCALLTVVGDRLY